jgi:hypothetical protein
VEAVSFTEGIALGYGLDDQGFDSRQGLGFFISTTASRSALDPTQPPIQWVPGAVSLGAWPVPVSELIFLKHMNLFGQLVGLLGWGIGPTQGVYLYTRQHNTEKHEYTFMPRVGFEPTVPVFERPKTGRASDWDWPFPLSKIQNISSN